MHVLDVFGSAVIFSAAAVTVAVKADSDPLTVEDCLCQCDGLQFLDRFERPHGNCVSVDATNKRWCYLKDAHSVLRQYLDLRRRGITRHNAGDERPTTELFDPLSTVASSVSTLILNTTCQDAKRSIHFIPGKAYGYHACATPPVNHVTVDQNCQDLIDSIDNDGIPNSNSTCSEPLWRGDTWCDDENNTEECGWDGGDCCRGGGGHSRREDWNRHCTQCKCLDPNHN